MDVIFEGILRDGLKQELLFRNGKFTDKKSQTRASHLFLSVSLEQKR